MLRMASARGVGEEIPIRKRVEGFTKQVFGGELSFGGIVAMFFVVYIIIGVVFYSALENFSVGDAIYFTVNTFLSIGYNSMGMTGKMERFFTGFFVLLGAGFAGSAIGILLGQESDSQEEDLERYRNSKAYKDRGGDATFSRPAWEKAHALRKLCISCLEIFIVMAIGTIIMGLVEVWSFPEAFYWAAVTITTTGYGDLVPTGDSTKWFTTVYSVIGVVTLARALSFIARFPLIQRRLGRDKEVLRRLHESTDPKEVCEVLGFPIPEDASSSHSEQSLVDLVSPRAVEVMDHLSQQSALGNGEGGATPHEAAAASGGGSPGAAERQELGAAEFAVRLLLLTGRVSAADVAAATAEFAQLDRDGDGRLRAADYTAKALRADPARGPGGRFAQDQHAAHTPGAHGHLPPAVGEEGGQEGGGAAAGPGPEPAV